MQDDMLQIFYTMIAIALFGCYWANVLYRQ